MLGTLPWALGAAGVAVVRTLSAIQCHLATFSAQALSWHLWWETRTSALASSSSQQICSRCGMRCGATMMRQRWRTARVCTCSCRKPVVQQPTEHSLTWAEQLFRLPPPCMAPADPLHPATNPAVSIADGTWLAGTRLLAVIDSYGALGLLDFSGRLVQVELSTLVSYHEHGGSGGG